MTLLGSELWSYIIILTQIQFSLPRNPFAYLLWLLECISLTAKTCKKWIIKRHKDAKAKPGTAPSEAIHSVVN